MRKFFKEFKDFISKGNVISMAVGIIIGSAFTAVVNSIVKNLITPLLGLICGGIDFSNYKYNVNGAIFEVGLVINAILTFIITAFVLFLMVKFFNRLENKLKKPAPAPAPAEPEPTREEKLLEEIRDLLKQKQ